MKLLGNDMESLERIVDDSVGPKRTEIQVIFKTSKPINLLQFAQNLITNKAKIVRTENKSNGEVNTDKKELDTSSFPEYLIGWAERQAAAIFKRAQEKIAPVLELLVQKPGQLVPKAQENIKVCTSKRYRKRKSEHNEDVDAKKRDLKIQEKALQLKEEAFERKVATFHVKLDEFNENIAKLDKKVEEIEEKTDTAHLESKMNEMEERLEKIEVKKEEDDIEIV